MIVILKAQIEDKEWSLETPYLSYKNHHFYEKLGLAKAGETEPAPNNDGIYLYLYEKVNP